MSLDSKILYKSILKQECPISFFTVDELVKDGDKKGFPCFVALIEKVGVGKNEEKFQAYRATDLTDYFIDINSQASKDSKKYIGFRDPCKDETCAKVIYVSNAISGTWKICCAFEPEEGVWQRGLLDLPEKYLKAVQGKNPFSEFLKLIQSTKNKEEVLIWVDCCYRTIPYAQKNCEKIDLKQVLDQLPKTGSAYQKILSCQYAAEYTQNRDENCIKALMDIAELFQKGNETIEKSPGDAFVGFGHVIALDPSHLLARLERARLLQFGYGEVEPDLAKALRAYQHILRLYPKNIHALLGIAEIVEAGFSYQEWSKEKAQYTTIKVEPSPKEALSFYESILTFDPERMEQLF